MKNLFFGLLCLVVMGNSFAQIKLEGFVKDSIEPLELANVVAINQATKTLDSYGITNDKGRFKLNLKPNTSYKVSISYIGYRSLDVIIDVKESDIDRDFTLQVDNSLDEIELTYEMPVTIRGDTMTYNADSFKSGTERKLEDILKKLPGVEINDAGEIEVEGKAVSKLMVNGKDFFDGDTKLATKNIPSNAVDKIEVLKNFSEVSQLRSVQNNQDNVAINIKLKEGKEKFWFGNVLAGGGTAPDDPLYILQPKLFYYSPKTSINFIGDMNNLGESAFSRRDFFNFTGGFRAPSQSSGTSINLGTNDLGFLQTLNNRAKDKRSKLGAMNFSHSPNKALDISGFLIYSSNRTEIQQNRFLQYTDPSLNIPDENTENNTFQASDQGMVKLSTKYIPNTNNQLEYDILGTLSKESQERRFFSSVNGDVGQNDTSDPFSIKQGLNYYYTLDNNNIFALSAQHLWKDEDPFYNAVLEDNLGYDDTGDDIGFDNFQSGYNLSQGKRVKSNQLDAKLDYWNVLSPKSNLNFTLGTIYSNQKFDSNIFQTLDNGSVLNPIPTINDAIIGNKVDYTFTDAYLGLTYRLKAGIFTFSPGVSVHTYGTKNDQLNTETKDNFVRLLPRFNTRIDIKNSESITVNYTMTTQFTDVTNIARGLVMNNYNSFATGVPDLENALRHNFNLNYRNFNMFNYTTIFGNMTYSRNENQIRSSAQFNPGSVVRVSTPFNSDFADESFALSGRFQRSFGKIRANLRANFSYNKFNQVINNRPSVNENYSHTYTVGTSSQFREAPNFDLSYRLRVSDNDQGARRTKFYTHTPTIEFDALIFKTFTFRTDFSYNVQKDEVKTLNKYKLWDASLAYRKDRDAKWEYEVRASNLFNTQSENSNNVGNFSVSFTEYFIQPRFVSFRLRYTL